MTLLAVYSLVVGCALALIGTLEIAFPQKAFTLWREWSRHRVFRIHGFFLIAGGIPLTIYRGPWTLPAVIIGAVAAITGPFILLYPEKIRDMFDAVAADMDANGLRKIMTTEGVLRIAAGAACIIGYFME